MDIILGAMAFRLNDLHKEKLDGSNKRGKRTIAKENLYKYILAEIRSFYPNFNIGITTGKTPREKNMERFLQALEIYSKRFYT
jgi:hypothetical protein